MSNVPKSLLVRLDSRKEAEQFRIIRVADSAFADFYSNDYLGFASNPVFQHQLLASLTADKGSVTSSTGSRLLSGTTGITIAVERFIAQKHGVEGALLFASGYMANLALFSSILSPSVTVLVDAFIHRSVRDGIILSRGKKRSFRHNDLHDLERLLKQSRGDVYVAVESLYSMNGDHAPLEELVRLCSQYGAFLIVDEAHAIGVYGLGLVHQKQLTNKVFAVLVTYGKAMGVAGAALLGSRALLDVIVNFSSPFIYSTAPSSSLALGVREAYNFLEANEATVTKLQQVIKDYMHLFSPYFQVGISPIQWIEIDELRDLDLLKRKLIEAHINCIHIRPPTVAVGSDRFRISLHAYNTSSEMERLLALLLSHKITKS